MTHNKNLKKPMMPRPSTTENPTEETATQTITISVAINQ
jgi:hypothetical protein